MEEKEGRYIGAYIPNTTYMKLRLFCAKKDVSVNKVLLTLVSTLVKDVKLDCEINNEPETTIKS